MRFAWIILVASTVLQLALPARAQFRNQGIQAPNIGWLGLSTWDTLMHGGRAARQNLDVPNGVPEFGWNLIDQPTVGAGYFFAVGYDLWIDNQVAIGAFTTVTDQQSSRTPVLSLAASSGIRYNLLSERIRPFLSAHIQYLQLIALPAAGATAPIPGNNFLGNTPFFVGLRPGGGVEWIFGNEMSLQAELGVIGFIVPDPNRGLGGLFLPASLARLSYNIYF
jgi:hypothetical protein